VNDHLSLGNHEMNRLSSMRCYLCGPMDRAADGGSGWRQQIQYDLRNYGLHFLDPCNKPTRKGAETPETRKLLNEEKLRGNFNFVAKEMKWIRRVDLRMVHLADFLIVHLDMDIHACGSYEEITWANQEKKPILVHIEQGKKYAPNWLFGMIPHYMIFSTWSELRDHMEFISCGSYGKQEDWDITDWSDNRWHIFDWMGDK